MPPHPGIHASLSQHKRFLVARGTVLALALVSLAPPSSRLASLALESVLLALLALESPELASLAPESFALGPAMPWC